MPAIVPDGYTRLREAILAVAAMRHAGLEAHEAVKKAREEGYESRFTREELEARAKVLWTEIDKDKISVWIEQTTSGRLLKIDAALLDGIPNLRRYSGGDLTYLRPQHLLYMHLEKRFPRKKGQVWPDWLKRFQLLVRDTELKSVEAKIRQLRKLQKSRPASSTLPGRPIKTTKAMPSIKSIVESGKWAFPDTLKKLTNLVNRATPDMSLSDRTVERALQELFEETADNRYHRPKKNPPRLKAP